VLGGVRHIWPRLLVTIFVVGLVSGSSAGPSPAGSWVTVDDKTHKSRGTIFLFEENGAWSGRIETIYDPAERANVCTDCPGDRKGKPVAGMVVMWGMVQHGGEYSGGEILDVDTGSIYRCRFSMSADGSKMMVRGYFGISLIGRTQIWTRANA